MGRPVISSAVIIFRISSSASGNVRPSGPEPVVMMPIRLASKPFPDP